MEAAFATGDAVPAGVGPSARAAALAWVPPGLRAFDTGRAEAAEVSGAAPKKAPANGGVPEVPAESPAVPGNGGAAPGPEVPEGEPEGEAEGKDAWETVHEASAASQSAPVPGNGHDPGALPAFLRHTA